MEALLQIIESTEKNRLERSTFHEKGIYHLNVPNIGGYARCDMPFCAPDSMHQIVVNKGNEPAFPEYEDVPRDEHISFDAHYFLVGNKIHRITTTRAHGPESSFIKACFVDGDLVFLSGAGRGDLKVYLINPERWQSGAIKGSLPKFWFYVDNQRIDVIADVYYSYEKSLWMGIMPKSPSHYGIFVNDQSTLNQNSTVAQFEQKHMHYWVSICSLVFLLPFWLVWMFLDSFFILPAQLCNVHCEVRKYWVRQERGEDWYSQNLIDDSVEPNEKTRLLA